MKWLKWTGVAVAALLVVLALLLTWALTSESGARFVLAKAQSALAGKLSIERSSGSLSGPLHLHGVHYNDADAGVDARIGEVSVQLALGALLGKRVHIKDLAISDVDVRLSTPAKPAEPSSEPFSLEAPIDILIDRLALQRAVIRQEEQTVFEADRLDLAGAWTSAGMIVDSLALHSPDGEVSLKGTLATAKGYSGDGDSQFRWRVADVDYAGSLTARSDGNSSNVNVILSEPMAATLSGTIGQTDAMPWTLKLDAPAFALKRVLADSSIGSVALTLQGSGDRNGGTLEGELGVDAYRARLNPLRWSLDQDILHIESLTLTSPDVPGQFNAKGDIHLDTTPVSARLNLDWDAVELPADLVGQALATHGDLAIDGSAEIFHAEGALAVGPPGQLSDIRVKLTGTPQAIALETLALVQPKGGLDAHGTLTLQPAFAWQLQAKATAFDPGAFAADWPGALDFDLGSVGVIGDQGLQATLTLEQLSGQLRERPVSGHADLRFEPDYVIDGSLRIDAGKDSLRVEGHGGQQTDANVNVEIASLGHWLTDAEGGVRGQFHIHGAWPQLDVDANANASNVSWNGSRISSADLVAAIKNIEQPSGQLSLKASGVSQGDTHYEAVTLEASGNQAAHQLDLHAQGSPADLNLSLSGSAKGQTWDGLLKTLAIAPKGNNLPDFTLTEASALRWDGSQFSLADSCLSGSTRSRQGNRNREGQTGNPDTPARSTEPALPAILCVGGDFGSDGSLAARYRIEHLPLRLLLGLAAPESPIRLRGEIEGRGDIRRSAAGVLSGDAQLGSSNGSALHESSTQPVMSYTDLKLNAEFGASSSHITLGAALDHEGRLDGRVTLSGAEQNLDGSIDLVLPDLAFIELLTTALANTQGRLDAHYRIGGSVATPELNGELTLKDFTTELPDVGLRLHDGQISLRGAGDQRFVLDGHIMSGDGTLAVQGEGGLAAEDALKITLSGDDILAVDIPAARVVVSPNLVISRDADSGMLVTGSVTVPKAKVDLAKLPGGGARAASPDVVVTDDALVEPGKAMPFNARVDVILGDDVKLAGFGFDGKLTGKLAVNERPGRATIGTGSLDASGTYKAYGQDLTIESGRILFASAAIDNPGLNIRAVRKLEADRVTAGLMVRGTAQMPVLTVFSDPAMEQSNALSYLVTGKPLSALKSGEGDMLGTAARALGTAGGDLLAKSIGGRLGVDDIGVADNSTLGGAAFTVGKYLSPKLYLSYGVGIFDPGEVVTLRYLFNTRWNFEAQNATTGSRAGMNYRYEKQ